MRSDRLKPIFVETMPDNLEDGALYVSMQYAMTIHRCACGCGHEVVAPLAPTSWTMTFDGANISLEPSIGNWSLPCRSHYLIRRGRVRWADMISQEAIDRGRCRDAISRSSNVESLDVSAPDVFEEPTKAVEADFARNWWQLLRDRCQR